MKNDPALRMPGHRSAPESEGTNALRRRATSEDDAGAAVVVRCEGYDWD
jgi:hypothetical protein